MRTAKPLLPSLRERKRYLVFEVLSDSRIADFGAVAGAITDASRTLYGELGLAKQGLWLLKEAWDGERQRGILRVNRSHVDEAKLALAAIRRVGKGEAAVRSLGVSGILKKARERFLAA
ncbi:hypothetical protein JXB02_00830 [Candidatus Woesearchaeota archaeon]|nr:hypothetical protein [Candidatus Woesearchaeota archaeon]